MARSPLIWLGGKCKVAQHIISYMPPHRCYVEPFGGAAHVLAQKSPVDCEVYNDIDGNLVNFLMVARERPEELARACDTLPYSRELYERWKREPLPDDPFERAVRFFYLNRSGVAKGNKGQKTGWRHSGLANTARAYHNAAELIVAFGERMRNVMIDNRDFREVIRVYDGPHTLFYVDPPYVEREQYYKGNFSEQDHRDLAEMLRQVKGKVILSYYEHPLVLELYHDWRVERYQSFRQVVNGDNCYAEELLLMNFDDGQMTIDELVQSG